MKQRKPRKRVSKEIAKAQKAVLDKAGVSNVMVENGSVPNPHDG